MAADDQIEIVDVRAEGIVGLHEWERTRKQPIRVDLVLFLDLAAAGASDRVEDAVDYGVVAREVQELLSASSRYTIEALAEDVAALCLRHVKVRRVRVRVEKPQAETCARVVAATIERGA